MNRYGRPPGASGPSKATPTTLCQKCLKRDMSFRSNSRVKANRTSRHYSYECKSAAQDRPYVSRPSRTQQLLNPKLMPKLSSEVSPDILRKKGIADEQLAKIEQERGRKRERQSEGSDFEAAPKRRRSASISSVSTISTSRSRSQSAHMNEDQSRKELGRGARASSQHRSFETRSSTPEHSHAAVDSTKDFERKRRRSSVSTDSYSSRESDNERQTMDARNTRRRYQRHSPVGRGRRRSESHSPFRAPRGQSNDRPKGRNDWDDRRRSGNNVEDMNQRKAPPRQRSLSPFSKRLALTQAMNADG